MDHIPLSNSNQSFVLPEVPYLCRNSYSDNLGVDFASYPAKAGFDKQRLAKGDYSQHSQPKTAIFLQSWLFFGLLGEFIGTTVDRRPFIATGRKGQIVSTREALPQCLEQWAKQRPTARSHLDRIEACLTEARAFAPILLDRDNPLPPEVALSISILGATLHIVNIHFFPVLPPVRFSQPAHAVWGVPHLVQEWLLEAGWCINDSNRLAETQSLPTMIAAASIRRAENITANAHRKCSVDACVARHFNERDYVTKHVLDSRCDCGGHIALSDEQVSNAKKILDDGGIPVVLVQRLPKSKAVTLQVTKADQTRYVAFSHVWADGLGNRQQNSLPACQLLRLLGLAEDLYEPVDKPKTLISKLRPNPKPMAI